MNYKYTSYKDKPEGIYKTSDSECNCANCGYLNDKYCELRKIKLDIFYLTKRRCRDFICKDRGISININKND